MNVQLNHILSRRRAAELNARANKRDSHASSA